MAILVAESLQSDSGSATSLSIDTGTFTPNPSVGDLLLAQYCYFATGDSITLPSGWTQIVKTENAGDSLTSQISYKVADSSDASGQNLTWTKSGAATDSKLSLIRITGQRATSPIATSSGQSNDVNATVTIPTITPTFEDSAILMFEFSDSATGTSSGYTITTSPPSFTELYDNNTNNTQFSAAWGVRPEITATGSGTITISTGSPNSVGQMICVSAPQSITTLDTVATSDAIEYSLGILILEVLSIVEVTATLLSNRVRNIAKNVSSWFNQDKS